MLNAIEARWKKADQDAFIAALILNPFHKTRPLQPLFSFSVGGVYALLSCLWEHFYTVPVPVTDLLEDVQEYLMKSGHFADIQSWQHSICLAAEAMKTSPDSIQVWDFAQHPEALVRPIIQLACRLLSVCTNSASCKRLFSSLGHILTKLRNCLGNTTLLSLTEMKMHICDEHLCNQGLQRRLKFQLEGDCRQTAQVTENAGSAPEPILLPLPPPPSSAPDAMPKANEEEISSEELMQEL
ncbi:uncharacterized protein PHACADRAFT_201944 [Phanerochaete carnosa HHB-10118-sp]|uniref:HAT C-terminal dimerisation domain-containing protein n=1 Tax=Phanerochaete carnosa (strain HHB-10118-sp) TaxID=650164 RepID=K5VR02_PHACS|nr:uncharacterized protein PHACADRAFT_201944 [Phanerochaete carnosa HHB-10118-sp]EKM49170.1 hypothetical protein PHACADRAFT_201944 [Phanerochaete carnosa HHB-10118-sp]